jgi:oxygen-independent coproporphyrinogen-3 oxidase
MVGETWDNWRDCVRQTIALSPDSVTIYQMELPYNTVFSKELKVLGQDEPQGGIADWPTKRAWVHHAFDELQAAGYQISSAYTLVKDRLRTKFVYRDSLWHGADMFGTGVASFGHVHGVHVQNVDGWDQYVGMAREGRLPLGRALLISPRERLIREVVLQLKTGRLDASYFQRKFNVHLLETFAEPFAQLAERGLLVRRADGVDLTRAGLLEIDRHLPLFFDPHHRGARYA